MQMSFDVCWVYGLILDTFTIISNLAIISGKIWYQAWQKGGMRWFKCQASSPKRQAVYIVVVWLTKSNSVFMLLGLLLCTAEVRYCMTEEVNEKICFKILEFKLAVLFFT